MCLTTDNPTVKVAEQDIKVYKSLYFHEQRVRSKNFFKRLFGMKDVIVTPKSGVQNFKYMTGALQPSVELQSYPDGNRHEYHRGYHSDADIRSESNALFVIPKGTKYVEGWFNQNYVSETIVYVKRLK